MKIMTIDQSRSPILRTEAKWVTFPLSIEIKQFIEEFKAFIKSLESPYGKPAGLAATQVGVDWQIFLLQIPEEAKKIRKDVFDVVPLSVWINAQFTPIEAEGKYKDWEGCYSVPDQMGEVYRYKAVAYEAYTPEGEKIEGVARGLLARIIQHEVGHLRGQLFTDLVTDDCRCGSFEGMWKIRKQEMQNK